jgi:alkylated DNA repair dioxygenase AlkB
MVGEGQTPPHPVLLDAQRAIAKRYGKPFAGFSMNWYRDGNDLQAFHRDRDLRWLDDTVIAILTLGARRPWHVRPRANRYAHEAPHKGATHDFAPAGGDLLVMGGATQVGWEHGVPMVRVPVTGRVSVQWRWTSRRGRPVEGASYRAPRNFSR